MKKTNLKIILPVLFLLAVVFGSILFVMPHKDNTDKETTNSQKIMTQLAEKSWEEDTPEDIYKTESINADFAVTYDSYEDVVKASELVVTGEVKGIYAFFENDRVISHYELKVQESSNETVKRDDVITIYSIGGKIKYSEYAKNFKEELLASMTKEEYDKLIEERGNSYIEDIFEGVPNLKIGDRVALCLGTSDEIGEADYYIVGTSYYGQFMWDENENSVYKLNVEVLETNKRKYTQKDKIALEDFKQKTKLKEE